MYCFFFLSLPFFYALQIKNGNIMCIRILKFLPTIRIKKYLKSRIIHAMPSHVGSITSITRQVASVNHLKYFGLQTLKETNKSINPEIAINSFKNF